MVGLCDLCLAGDEGVNLGSAILRSRARQRTHRSAHIDALRVLHDRWFPVLGHDLSLTCSPRGIAARPLKLSIASASRRAPPPALLAPLSFALGGGSLRRCAGAIAHRPARL